MGGRSLLVAVVVAVVVLLMLGSQAAWAREGSDGYIRYDVFVNADVTGGPLARYGFDSFYARILAPLDPNGTVIGTAYIVDSYPAILFTPYWRGYVEDVLNKALAILSASLRNPPASGGWVADGSSHTVVFVVSSDGVQEVYKCRARGWVTTVSRGHGIEGGRVKVYTDPTGRYPLYLEAEFTTGWYRVKVRAQAEYFHAIQSPCGHPVSTGLLKDAIGFSALAVTAAALVAYAKRPRAPVIIVREAYWP